MPEDVQTLIRVPSGEQPVKSGRIFRISASDFAQVEQGNPAPVGFGTFITAGFAISPVLGFRSSPIQEKIGKKKTTIGYTYNGSFVVLLNVGQVKTLNSISNGDTVIYTGPTDVGSADGDGKTVLTTDIGTINFYWGTASQNADSFLSSALISIDGGGPATVTIPPWRQLCYAVCLDLSFGEQAVQPTLKFDMTVETSGLTLGAHQTNGDAIISEVIYQSLVNTLFGMSVDSSDIDSTSFETAGTQSISDDFGISNSFDEFQQAREVIGKLCWYDESYLYLDEGKIKYKQIRSESTGGLATLDEDDFMDEPLPNNNGFEDTWNMTYLTFRDGDYGYEEAVEPYEDAANLTVQEKRVTKEVNAPFISRRQNAKIMAKRIGEKGGIPSMGYTLRLLPEHDTYRIGDRFFLTYSKLGISSRLVRIGNIKLPTRSNPAVTVEVVEEWTRDTSNDFVPSTDPSGIPTNADEGGLDPYRLVSTTPRLAWLNEDLKEGLVDGFEVLCDRPTVTTRALQVWFSWDPAQNSYTALTSNDAFPIHATVIWWQQTIEDTWLFKLQFPNDFDFDEMTNRISDSAEIRMTVGRRDVKTAGSSLNELRMLPIRLVFVQSGYYEATDTDTMVIEFTSEADADDAIKLETVANNGQQPALHAYIGYEGEFTKYITNRIWFETELGNGANRARLGFNKDTDLIRYIKTTVSTGVNTETLSDVTASTFDRDDTTDGQDGSLSVSWGDPVRTAYEHYDCSGGILVVSATEDVGYDDVEDIDLALNLVYQGIDGEDEQVLTDYLDRILGAAVELDYTHYNLT